MHSDISNRKALLASLFSSVFLAACGGGGDGSASTTSPESASVDTSAKLVTQSDSAMAQAQSVRNGSTPPMSATGVLLGSTTIQAGLDTNPAGLAEAFVFTATTSGSSSTLNLYLDKTSTAQQVTVAVYADASGNPGKLLTTGATTKPVAGAWNAVTVSSVSITAGTRYWISVLTPVGAGTIMFRDIASGGGGTVTSKQSNLAAMPSTWSSGSSWGNSPLSAYLAIASVSAPAPTPAPTPAPAPPPTVGSASLAWSPVTNSAVTGYRVYYGTASHTYAQAAGSGLYAGNASTFVVSGLPKGHVYYFAVTSVDGLGNESPVSNEATKSL